eukprot:scaffold3860_cov116-Cylindrotheca_fusiformis.AAC.3
MGTQTFHDHRRKADLYQQASLFFDVQWLEPDQMMSNISSSNPKSTSIKNMPSRLDTRVFIPKKTWGNAKTALCYIM